ncbi:MAG: non-ribosomal peptide synthetase, partial [bacterium]|nr:non-ribosomal peptide synthetase [bacterium]
ISDGVSHGIFVREFFAIYGKKTLPPGLQYKDFCQWQNDNLEKEKETFRKQEQYWIRTFSGDLPQLNLPMDYTRPAVLGSGGGSVTFEIAKEEVLELRKIASEQKGTLYMVLLSVYYVLLHKLSGAEDIVVGTSLAGRRHPDLNNIIGMFVNNLALRNFPDKKLTFREFLDNVIERTLTAFENQESPLEKLVEKMVAARSPGRNPLFDVMLVLNNESDEFTEPELPDLKIKPYPYEPMAAQMDLKLRGKETTSGGVTFLLEYSTMLFQKKTIEMFIKNFSGIISTVIKNRDISLEAVNITHDFTSARTDILKDDEGDFDF